MKKLLALLLALILRLGVLVACDRDKESEPSARPSGDSELNFYHRQTKQASLDKAPSESFFLRPLIPKTDIEFEIDASKPITVYKTTYHFVSSN